jgi:hypothetical protein
LLNNPEFDALRRFLPEYDAKIDEIQTMLDDAVKKVLKAIASFE